MTRAYLFLFTGFLLIGCNSSLTATPKTESVESKTAGNPPQADYQPKIVSLYVGPKKVRCTGLIEQDCFQVKESPEGQWELFYEPILGFEFAKGYQYKLKVRISQREPVVMDRSIFEYHLLEILEKTPTKIQP